ncbi:MAG: ATP-binding protein [Solobacterium sp.]|nr:ATP-binding protein [Solobacterium sp.]
MIKRTIFDAILESIKTKPVTLITGARQVGKTTLCRLLVQDQGFNYVSLDNMAERSLAISDPELFLQLHPWPLVIDEVQYAPILFDVLESIVNKKKFADGDNRGMYVLTGSQAYNLMEGISQSMSGRVGIIRMSGLSISEIKGVREVPFIVDALENSRRSKEYTLNINELYRLIVRGFYPELHDNPELDANIYYSDYVSTYIERDVSQVIRLTDKLRFQRFMEVLASMTGEELVYDTLAKNIGVSAVTIKNWISVLVAGEIITLLEPYSEISIVKRVVKRPKIYFNDTGLACYLARLNNPEVLSHSRFAGHFVETYIVNEIMKSYRNNRENAGFYYYRDKNQNEIDLIILDKGRLQLIECKTGTRFTRSDISAFKCMEQTQYTIGQNAVICTTDTVYRIEDQCYALPITVI